MSDVFGAPQALWHGAKMFICTAASELSARHILEPNKIMQLSNLKPRLAVKNNPSIEWNPLIASLYFLSLLGFTIYCRETDVLEICSRHLGFTSLAYIAVCRAR